MASTNHVYRNQQTISVGATDGPFLGSNRRRRGLIISCPAVGDAFISFNGPAVLNTGLALYNKGNPVILDHVLLGDGIQDEIRIIGSVGGQTVPVIEFGEG